jgi:hypothetical protein
MPSETLPEDWNHSTTDPTGLRRAKAKKCTMLDTRRHFSFIKQKIMDAGELCLVVYLGCMFG